MNEEFYAIVKLVTGEELFGIVSPTNEDGIEYLLLSDPIIFKEVELEDNYLAYKIEPWLKLSTERLYIIEKTKIITLIESFDEDLVNVYKTYIDRLDNIDGSYKLNRNEGFIDNVKDFRYTLEKLYKL